jgi:hypothetical protein
MELVKFVIAPLELSWQLVFLALLLFWAGQPCISKNCSRTEAGKRCDHNFQLAGRDFIYDYDIEGMCSDVCYFFRCKKFISRFLS